MTQRISRHPERPDIEAVSIAKNESLLIEAGISHLWIKSLKDIAVIKFLSHHGYTKITARVSLILAVKELDPRSLRIASDLLFIRRDRLGEPGADSISFAIHRVWERAQGGIQHLKKMTKDGSDYTNALVYLDEVGRGESVHTPEVFEHHRLTLAH